MDIRFVPEGMSSFIQSPSPDWIIKTVNSVFSVSLWLTNRLQLTTNNGHYLEKRQLTINNEPEVS